MRRVETFRNRDIGQVTGEFHYVAVGRRKSKDDGTMVPSWDCSQSIASVMLLPGILMRQVGKVTVVAWLWYEVIPGSSGHVTHPILQEQSSVGNAGSKHACALAGTRPLPS